MRSLVFEGNTWTAYEELRQKDQKLHKSLCRILKEMLRDDPAVGAGKPEPLKHNLSGLWSRRISQKDRVATNMTTAMFTFLPLVVTTINFKKELI